MADPLALINVFDVETETGPASLLCFLDPVLAGSRGIDPRAVIGPYGKPEDVEFDPETFKVNPAFVEALTAYMNERAAGADEVVAGAKGIKSDWLYIVDPRHKGGPDVEPPASHLLGAFAVDESGQVVPGSF